MKKYILILFIALYTSASSQSTTKEHIELIFNKQRVSLQLIKSTLSTSDFTGFKSELTNLNSESKVEELNLILDKYFTSEEKTSLINNCNSSLESLKALMETNPTPEDIRQALLDLSNDPEYAETPNCNKEGLKLCLQLAMANKVECEQQHLLNLISLGSGIGAMISNLPGAAVGACIGIIISQFTDNICEDKYNLEAALCTQTYCPQLNGGGSGSGSGSSSGGGSKPKDDGSSNNDSGDSGRPPGGGWQPVTDKD